MEQNERLILDNELNKLSTSDSCARNVSITLVGALLGLAGLAIGISGETKESLVAGKILGIVGAAVAIMPHLVKSVRCCCKHVTQPEVQQNNDNTRNIGSGVTQKDMNIA